MSWKSALVVGIGLTALGAGVATAAIPVEAPASASSTETAALSTKLVNTQWRFVEVGGAAVPHDVKALLRLRNGRASGRAGCNSFGTSWELAENGSTRFGALMSTQMACLAPVGAMAVQRGVFAALQHAVRIERDGDDLVLLDASGKPLARLQRDTAR